MRISRITAVLFALSGAFPVLAQDPPADAPAAPEGGTDPNAGGDPGTGDQGAQDGGDPNAGDTGGDPNAGDPNAGDTGGDPNAAAPSAPADGSTGGETPTATTPTDPNFDDPYASESNTTVTGDNATGNTTGSGTDVVASPAADIPTITGPLNPSQSGVNNTYFIFPRSTDYWIQTKSTEPFLAIQWNWGGKIVNLTFLLVNPDTNILANTVILARRIKSSQNMVNVTSHIAGVGHGYQILMVSSQNRSRIFAISEQFEVKMKGLIPTMPPFIAPTLASSPTATSKAEMGTKFMPVLSAIALVVLGVACAL